MQVAPKGALHHALSLLGLYGSTTGSPFLSFDQCSSRLQGRSATEGSTRPPPDSLQGTGLVIVSQGLDGLYGLTADLMTELTDCTGGGEGCRYSSTAL